VSASNRCQRARRARLSFAAFFATIRTVSGSVEELSKTRTLRPSSGESAEPIAPRFYLLVLRDGSSSLFTLPPSGIILIGRSTDADLPLTDETASRAHAKVITSDGSARVHDLGSHNGTFVNGERIDGTRALVSGDVLTIGEITLVLRADTLPPPAHPVLDRAALRQRLLEEVERATRYQRPLTVINITIAAATTQATRARLAETLAGELRLIDLVGWLGDRQLVVVIPEVGADARAHVDRLAALSDGAQVGVAVYPDDACDADTLVAAARAAAATSVPGRVALAGATARELVLGERTIVLADPAMVRLFELIGRLAASDLPVLILGETGAGKEGAALAVHHQSRRANGPFITLNCAAIAENLVESELFGHEKGAFTGAIAAKPGKLEAAHGGTLFLDEIGELSPNVQAKLLRALEQKRLSRVGEIREREVDLRIVAATHRSLEDDIKQGRFRQDLYFRLSAATLVLPPLRDRPREIPILARRFLADAREREGRKTPALTTATMQRLAAYAWPGNVRELRNVMEYVAATVEEDEIAPWHLPDRVAGVADVANSDSPATDATTTPPTTAATTPAASFRPVADELRELERGRMVQALESAGGVQTRAAELIGMPLRTFVMKLKQYGISPRLRRD
jgi:two-component system response regulator AtoC